MSFNPSWTIIIFTLISYIVLLYFYFRRQHKKQDHQLSTFLADAKKQLESHKLKASVQANQKVQKAFELIKKLQEIAEDLENQAKEEYEEILEDGQREKREIINDARQKAIEILASADEELEKYKEERKQEIEKNLVKLVMSVTEKVVERSLDYNTHIDLIQEAVNEVKQQKELL